MSRRTLPPLRLRDVRVRLLAASWDDAELGGVTDGGGPDGHDSRLLLHGDLWTQGSYAELACAITSSPYRRDFRAAYLSRRLDDQRSDVAALQDVTGRMPPNIFVPPDVAENAGYLRGDATVFEMPMFERHRRWARWPVTRP